MGHKHYEQKLRMKLGKVTDLVSRLRSPNPNLDSTRFYYLYERCGVDGGSALNARSLGRRDFRLQGIEYEARNAFRCYQEAVAECARAERDYFRTHKNPPSSVIPRILQYERSEEETERCRELGSYAMNAAVGSFSIALKNLAENLNLFMQETYKDPEDKGKLDLRDLKKNTFSAPRTKDERTLYEVFTAVHDHTDSNPFMKMRKKAAHAEGHDLIKRAGDTYFFDITNRHGSKDFRYDIETFLGVALSKYYEMTITCLRTIDRAAIEKAG